MHETERQSILRSLASVMPETVIIERPVYAEDPDGRRVITGRVPVGTSLTRSQAVSLQSRLTGIGQTVHIDRIFWLMPDVDVRTGDYIVDPHGSWQVVSIDRPGSWSLLQKIGTVQEAENGRQ